LQPNVFFSDVVIVDTTLIILLQVFINLPLNSCILESFAVLVKMPVTWLD